jgi:hypothetical protein
MANAIGFCRPRRPIGQGNFQQLVSNYHNAFRMVYPTQHYKDLHERNHATQILAFQKPVLQQTSSLGLPLANELVNGTHNLAKCGT